VLILVTDHLTKLAKDDPWSSALRVRIAISGKPAGTTVVSVEEVLRGWLAKIAAQRTIQRQVLSIQNFRVALKSSVKA
jgi:hypothetical protein